MRRTGLDILGQMPWGTHFCLFYQTADDLLELLLPYFKAGLEDNEFCLWVVSGPLSVERARAELAKVVPDLQQRMSRGQIEIIDGSPVYTAAGGFNPEPVVRNWMQKEAAAIQEGYEGFRLSGNVFGLDPSDWQPFMQYENAVDEAMHRCRMLSACGYHVGDCGPAEVIEVVSHHSFALIKRRDAWQRIENQEYRHAREELAISDGRFQVAAENLPQALVIYDAERRFQYMNRVALGWIGMEAGDLYGRRDEDVHGPELTGGYLPALKAAFATGQPQSVEFSVDLPAAHPTHRVTMACIYTPVLDESGRIRQVVALVDDVTERRAVAEALRQSEERFRVTLKNSPIGVYATDRELRYTWLYNPIFGLCAEQMLGRKDDELFDSRSVSELLALKTRVLASRRGERGRITIDLSGQERTFDVTVEPHFDPQGEVRGLIVATMDVTDLAAAKHQAENAARLAEAANAAKDQFLAALSHELRTPLTPVVMAASLLARDAHLPERYRDDVRIILRNAELEKRLIDDLLDLTRIARGKLHLDRKPLELAPVLKHAVDICRSEAAHKDLDLCLEIDLESIVVEGDAARVQQVFWNLVKNAVKFTPPGGRIVVRGAPAGDEGVVVQVSDSGAGIEPDTLPRLFSAFEQGGASTTCQFGGLGLGLAISKGIVERHGGAISAASPGPGQGSTFTVWLPRIPVRMAHEAVAAQPASPAAAGRSLAILLVEDHADSARIMRMLLTTLGHRVCTACDVASGLRIAHEQPFDLLISDIGLPDGSGIDLLRQLQPTRPIRAIALTGFGMDADVERTREAGFVAHLTKPVNIEQLESAIAAATEPANVTAVAQPG